MQDAKPTEKKDLDPGLKKIIPDPQHCKLVKWPEYG